MKSKTLGEVSLADFLRERGKDGYVIYNAHKETQIT